VPAHLTVQVQAVSIAALDPPCATLGNEETALMDTSKQSGAGASVGKSNGKSNRKTRRNTLGRSDTEAWLARIDASSRPAIEVIHRREHGKVLTSGLAWFSVGLGVTQLVAPGFLGDLAGLPGGQGRRRDLAIRACGARELVTGIGLLGSTDKTRWLQARVLGDAIELGLLATALTSSRSSKARLAVVMAAMAAVTALDIVATRKAVKADKRASVPRLEACHVGRATTVAASPDEVYRMWRDLAGLPRFMPHLRSVRELDDRHSEWVAKGPMGSSVKWRAEILEDRPGKLISWRSTDGSRVWNVGSVRFIVAPGGRGTEVVVEMHYRAPLGVFGAAIASVFGLGPDRTVDASLRRMKQLLEVGEIIESDASLHQGVHPARPTRRVARLIAAKGGAS
jgi:uncharacterized membrane protein